MNSLNEKVKGESSQEEENQMVDLSINAYINDMIKHTLRVY